MLVIVPNSLRNSIYEKVDSALERAPQFKDKREEIYDQMLEYFDTHGVVPDFDLQPKEEQGEVG